MGFDSLYTGISGLNAYQSWIDLLSNNIANIGTYGFKGQRMTFAGTCGTVEYRAKTFAGGYLNRAPYRTRCRPRKDRAGLLDRGDLFGIHRLASDTDDLLRREQQGIAVVIGERFSVASVEGKERLPVLYRNRSDGSGNGRRPVRSAARAGIGGDSLPEECGRLHHAEIRREGLERAGEIRLRGERLELRELRDRLRRILRLGWVLVLQFCGEQLQERVESDVGRFARRRRVGGLCDQRVNR